MLAITQIEMVGRLALACGLGVVMGFERELRGKAAGIRTHALVAVGSALFTLVGAYGFTDVPTRPDPTRVAAQIASGIGFIGAGAILRHGRAIAGLTTAATVWVSAALGVGAASGLYLVAGATAFGAVVVIVIVSQTQKVVRLRGRRRLTFTYRIGHSTLGPVLMAIEQIGVVNGVSVVDRTDEQKETMRTLTLEVDGTRPGALEHVVEDLLKRPEIVDVRWDDQAG